MFLSICLMILGGLVDIIYSTDVILNSAFFQENFKIKAFMDSTNYTRINITRPTNTSDEDIWVSIENSNNEDGYCMYVTEYYKFEDYYLIIPSMELVNPAAELKEGCTYNITFVAENEKRTENYTIHVLDCEHDAIIYDRCDPNSVIDLLNLTHRNENTYRVTWRYNEFLNKSQERDHNIVNITCIGSNNANCVIKHIKYHENAFDIPIDCINDGESYQLNVTYSYSDDIDTCYYFSTLNFTAPARNEQNQASSSPTILFIAILFLIIVATLASSYYICPHLVQKRKKVILSDDETLELFKDNTIRWKRQAINLQYIHALEYSISSNADPIEFPPEKLEIKCEIGRGAFGTVFYAKAHDLRGKLSYTLVAVKQLRENAPEDEVHDFLSEIEMLNKIGTHTNVVKMFGYVTKSEPYMMVMELVLAGDLKEYLLKLRDMWTNPPQSRHFFPNDSSYIQPENISVKSNILDTDSSTEIQPSYTEVTGPTQKNGSSNPKPSRSPIHLDKSEPAEDLTTFKTSVTTPQLKDMLGPPRPALNHKELENFAFQIASGMAYLENIPVTHRDLAARNILITRDKILKISDFGMSRTGPYVNRKRRKIPLRWMSLEAIENSRADSKSDVWSYGVVLWEIGTLGAFPYERIPDHLLLFELKRGTRLCRPEICTDDLYDVMKRCWKENPEDRPWFRELVEILNIKKHVYVHFDKINSAYVFPPTSYVGGGLQKT